MRPAAPAKRRAVRSEQIILFRVSGQLFAISSSSVQEVRSADSLAGAASEIVTPVLKKVKHIVRRGEKSLYVVNGALHFGLPASASVLVFILRHTRTAVLLDGIEKMSTMTVLQALPHAFCHEERRWYRGLTALDQNVVPVVNPEGFLTDEELALLDASMAPAEAADLATADTGEGTEAAQ
jgi:chemotaxis signal transduction protein